MASLQEQLLKAGLADSKKAKKINKEKRKQAKQTPKGQRPQDDTAEAARRALAEKAERDREINRQRNQEAEQKAIQAQIKQLIERNRIERRGGDVAHQFTHGKKIKKLHVSGQQHEQLSRGLIAIVALGEHYELVPAVVAEKIAQRDAARVIVHHDKRQDTVNEDDPYADYQIPDDLMW